MQSEPLSVEQSFENGRMRSRRVKKSRESENVDQGVLWRGPEEMLVEAEHGRHRTLEDLRIAVDGLKEERSSFGV